MSPSLRPRPHPSTSVLHRPMFVHMRPNPPESLLIHPNPSESIRARPSPPGWGVRACHRGAAPVPARRPGRIPGVMPHARRAPQNSAIPRPMRDVTGQGECAPLTSQRSTAVMESGGFRKPYGSRDEAAARALFRTRINAHGRVHPRLSTAGRGDAVVRRRARVGERQHVRCSGSLWRVRWNASSLRHQVRGPRRRERAPGSGTGSRGVGRRAR